MSKKSTYEEENKNLITTAIENAGSALENASSSTVTEYIQENVEYRASAGLKETIIREELSNCCKWCHDLAGEYEYGTEPDDIYRRHDNCKCIVLFKSAKGKYQDVWSKKEHNSLAEARQDRLNAIKQESEKEYSKLKRIAKDNGESCVDAKLKWESKRVINPTVEEKEFAVVDGVKYVNGKSDAKVKLDYSVREKETALLLSKKLGVNIELIPRVLCPQEKRTPDYLINGMRFDRKGIKGGTHNTIGNAVGSLKKDGRIQAENMVLDISEGSLSRDEALYYLRQAYDSKHYKYLNTTIVIDKEEIVAILERI